MLKPVMCVIPNSGSLGLRIEIARENNIVFISTALYTDRGTHPNRGTYPDWGTLCVLCASRSGYAYLDWGTFFTELTFTEFVHALKTLCSLKVVLM